MTMPVKAPYDWSTKRVAVPGGAGFIGSHVVEQLVVLGADVLVIDDLSRGRLDRLDRVFGKYEFLQLDVTEDSLAKQLQGCDAVLNLAGVAPGVAPMQDRHCFLKTENLKIGRNVLAAVCEASVKRYLMVSSSCIYPDEAPVPTPEISLDDSEPERANIGYGQAKRILEKEAIICACTHPELKIAIARPFNVIGARDLYAGDGGHVVPSLLGRIHDDSERLIVWGGGRQTRSFIHAKDMAAAMVRLTENYAVADPVNIGSAEEISVKDLVERLMGLSGKRKPLHFDLSKPEGARRKAADISKFKMLFPDFEPENFLDKSLREIVVNFQASLNIKSMQL